MSNPTTPLLLAILAKECDQSLVREYAAKLTKQDYLNVLRDEFNRVELTLNELTMYSTTSSTDKTIPRTNQEYIKEVQRTLIKHRQLLKEIEYYEF